MRAKGIKGSTSPLIRVATVAASLARLACLGLGHLTPLPRPPTGRNLKAKFVYTCIRIYAASTYTGNIVVISLKGANELKVTFSKSRVLVFEMQASLVLYKM